MNIICNNVGLIVMEALSTERIDAAWPSLTGERADRCEPITTGMLEHAAGKLTWVSEGAQRVYTSEGVWLTTPEQAVWIPSGVPHDAAKRGRGSYYWINVWDDDLKTRLPDHCCAVTITPELREAILHAAEVRTLERSSLRSESVRAVFIENITDAGIAPLALTPLEESRRLQPLMAAMQLRPADPRSLEEWAEFLRMSPRTLNRTFQRELGMSFRDWRRQTQLMHALDRLAQGDGVSQVAQQVGFKSVSMFIEMFRRTLGTTPGKYFGRREAPLVAAGKL
jgi:AraC-like DNA-binding protein